MAGAKKVLASNVFVGGRLFLAGDSPEKEYADQITNPKAWGGDEPADADEGGKGYDGKKVDELAEEADKRGLEVEGTGKDGKVVKADLVAALEADDAASA
ncbi:MAG: hypothetical protein ABWX71_02525 [Aeromicrobium sp.]